MSSGIPKLSMPLALLFSNATGLQKRSSFLNQYGPRALVTGAAVGMGWDGMSEAFAERIATQGIDLVLTEIQGNQLEQTAE